MVPIKGAIGRLMKSEIRCEHFSISAHTQLYGHSVVIVSACFEFDPTDTSQINDYYDNETEIVLIKYTLC